MKRDEDLSLDLQSLLSQENEIQIQENEENIAKAKGAVNIVECNFKYC